MEKEPFIDGRANQQLLLYLYFVCQMAMETSQKNFKKSYIPVFYGMNSFLNVPSLCLRRMMPEGMVRTGRPSRRKEEFERFEGFEEFERFERFEEFERQYHLQIYILNHSLPAVRTALCRRNEIPLRASTSESPTEAARKAPGAACSRRQTGRTAPSAQARRRFRQ